MSAEATKAVFKFDLNTSFLFKIQLRKVLGYALCVLAWSNMDMFLKTFTKRSPAGKTTLMG